MYGWGSYTVIVRVGGKNQGGTDGGGVAGRFGADLPEPTVEFVAVEGGSAGVDGESEKRDESGGRKMHGR